MLLRSLADARELALRQKERADALQLDRDAWKDAYERTAGAVEMATSRPSTRDAALREEGRVQGLREALEEVKPCDTGGAAMCAHSTCDAKRKVMARISARIKQAAQPDASQGSAPGLPDDETQRGLWKLAMRGYGAGSTLLHNWLNVERSHGSLDWRQVAVSLTTLANQMHAIATDATALKCPAPVIHLEAPPAAPQDAPGRLEPHDWISQHAPGVEQRTFCSRCGADLADEEADRWCKPTRAARGETGTPAAPQGSPLPGEDEPPCSLACKNACPPPLHLWKQAAGSRDEYHRLLVLHGYAYAQPRNPTEGGALEGCNHIGPFSDGGATEPQQHERNQLYNAGFEQGAKHAEKQVVRWLRAEKAKCIEFAEEMRKRGKREEPRRWESRGRALSQAADSIAAGDHIQPPAPAIPQSAPTGLVCGHPFADGSFCNQSADDDHGHPRIPQSGDEKEGTDV